MRTRIRSSALFMMLGGMSLFMLGPISAGRSYSGGRLVLEIDGQGQASARSATGGHLYAEIAPGSGDPGARRSVGKSRVSDLVVDVNPTEAQGLLRQALANRGWRFNGKLASFAVDGKGFRQREFSNSVVTEVAFPAFDAGGRDLGFVTLALRPESVKTVPGVTVKSGDASKQKNWVVSNFRLSIDGVDCSRVSRIEPLTFRQGMADTAQARARDPGGWSASNLVFAVPPAQAKSFQDWFDEAVLQGKSLRKNARVELLTADLKTVVMELNATGVHILAVRDDVGFRGDANTAVEVECFVEQWSVGGK